MIHTIRSVTSVKPKRGKSQSETLRLHVLVPIEVLHHGMGIFNNFLLPCPWTWPDYLYIRTWPLFRIGVLDDDKWTSYVKTYESCSLIDIAEIQTCRHYTYNTDRHTWNTTSLRWWSNINVLLPPIWSSSIYCYSRFDSFFKSSFIFLIRCLMPPIGLSSKIRRESWNVIRLNSQESINMTLLKNMAILVESDIGT